MPLQFNGKGTEVIVLSVYGDESHDGKEEKVYVVSGVGGTEQDWIELSSSWNQITGGKIFHAADCDAGKGAYKDIDIADRRQLFKKLVQAIVSSRIMGFALVTDLIAFHEFNQGVVEKIPYHHCFLRVVEYFAFIGRILIPPEIVTFTFEMNPEMTYSSGVLYDYMVTTDEWEYGSQLSPKISFANKNYVGIQVADIVAREAMKHYLNFYSGPKKYDIPRLSFAALNRTNRFSFRVHGRAYWQWFREQFEEISKQSGISVEKYKEWLIKNKLPDNVTSRNRYMLFLNNEQKETVISTD